MANIDKKLLKRLKILYVEDDNNVRNELTSLLSNFFDIVYSASDGKEGLELYREKKDEIDVIIADINMPNLTGIEMVKEIRKFDKDVNVVFATAYSDNEFLSEAIKLKVYEYITKPIDIRNLMAVLSELAKIIYHEFLLKQQNKELKKYRDIIYSNNIVIRTNKNLKISFVNDLFCQITGFDKKELVGKDLDVLMHPDSDSKIYSKIKSSILNNKQFNGKLKNRTKDGNYYLADSSVIATLNDAGGLTGALIIQKDETQEAIKRREVQNYLIKDKGDIFIKSKESSAELQYEINKLKDELRTAKKAVDIAKADKDKYIYTAEKFTVENKRLKSDLEHYRRNFEFVEDKHSHVKKLVKEAADQKIEIRKLNAKLDTADERREKECKQIKVNYEVKIDDMEQEMKKLKDRLDSVENAEAVAQKLSYWKEKAKNEAKRVEKLEKDIMKHADKDLMSRIFGGRR